jgi:hypothetical protein
MSERARAILWACVGFGAFLAVAIAANLLEHIGR